MAGAETAGAARPPVGEHSADPLPHSLQDPATIIGSVDSLTLAGEGVIAPPQRRRHAVSLTIDGDSLTWDLLVAALEADDLQVTLAQEARERMTASRRGALAFLAADSARRAYGWNQALGPLKDLPLEQADQRQFQVNVLRSHAAGVGEYLSPPIARLALLIRANVLARGTTGARPELVDRILTIIGAGVVPLMPEVGSLGTGDLQPMAAAGLCLIGEKIPAADSKGMAPADDVLRRNGLDPAFVLETGEAIALISGSAVLSACLVAAVRRLDCQVDTFLAAFALFCEATRAEKQAFDPRMHAERHIPAETVANRRILALIADSEWMTATGRARLGELRPRIQDSTSVRSTPHKVASTLRALDEAKRELVWEANASTANPLVLPDDAGRHEFVSGGNWDCTVLGHSAHALNVRVTDLAVLGKDLAGRLGNELWSYGLPSSLAGGQVGINSGMSLVHAVAASLIPEMQVRTSPVGSLSFPIKGGQEDNNTMAMASARNLVSNLDRFDVVLAVMALMSAQGVDLIRARMTGLALGSGSTRAHGRIREQLQPLDNDRYMTDDIKTMTGMVRARVFSLRER